MSYFDELNNVELFATYALTKPGAWDRLVGQAIVHSQYGYGIVKEKSGVILQIKFSGDLKFHCELDFFGSQLPDIKFVNISFPLNLNRESLIETLCYWERRQSHGYNLGSAKGYRRRVTQAELAYQRKLVEQEYIKIENEKERMMYNADEVRLQREDAERARRAGIHAYRWQEAQSSRDE